MGYNKINIKENVMEKTTKKKKSKRLKRRIGLIAIGGMSLVLTVCLSVGATLAWFAGSTWASNDLYMGGPVYVEMAGRGHAGSTTGTGANEGKWVGGDGKLDIVASARTTGTAKSGTTSNKQNVTGYDTSDVLLPGQKLLIYSQARVFSTAYYDDLSSGNYPNQSSGANTYNTTNGTTTYTSSTGVKKTTTTSVLRAKFSIDVEFDPTVGFNNFTDPSYANGYPVQSSNYTGDGYVPYDTYTTGTGFAYASGSTISWADALEGSANWGHLANVTNASGYTTTYQVTVDNGTKSGLTKNSYTGRRDAVDNDVYESGYTAKIKLNGTTTVTLDLKPWVKGLDFNERVAIKEGKSQAIYEWKYVSKDEYDKAGTAGHTDIAKMEAPFDGQYNSLGEKSQAAGGSGNGYYGVWVLKNGQKQESDAFYKARCNEYIKSYKEHYEDEYNRMLILSIGAQITNLEDALNDAFVGLVNESSDYILAGNVSGFTADSTGAVTHRDSGATPTSATWLYVDQALGNDTNASDGATSVGGWWYLVESDSTNTVKSGKNEVKTIVDSYPGSVYESDTGYVKPSGWTGNVNGAKNNPVSKGNLIRKSLKPSGYSSTATEVEDDDSRILQAKLYEITPDAKNGVVEEIGNGNGTYKVVSVSFPFVNGNFELPGRELTNIFANAKITFKITFQALQAFFPFTPSIDGCAAGSALAGTGKALNIGNAIPIYNEAFDYLSYLTN